MTLEEIEDLAMVPNAIMPVEMDQEDQVLFQKFRYLHAMHRIGGISREQAVIEKKRFLVDHQNKIRKEAFRKRQSDHTVAMWREMERLLCAYRRDRTLEIADKLVEAMDGKVNEWNSRKVEGAE